MLRSEETEINVKDLAVALVRRWWLIVLVTIIFALGTLLFYTVRYEPTYKATAKMYVNNGSLSVGSAKLSISSNDLYASQQLINTYSEIMKTKLTLNDVIHYLKLDKGYDWEYYDLVNHITCGSSNDTEIFYISVTSHDPDCAINTVNKIVDILPKKIAEVIEGSSAKTVDKADDASVVNPGIVSKVLVGTLIGLVLSCAYVLITDYFMNDSVETVDWLKEKYNNIPVLAEIPDIDDDGTGGKYSYRRYGRYGKYYGKGYYRKHGSDYVNRYDPSVNKTDKNGTDKK